MLSDKKKLLLLQTFIFLKENNNLLVWQINEKEKLKDYNYNNVSYFRKN